MKVINRIGNRNSLNQIVIKPNDQSLVGKFIRSNLWQDYHYGQVLFVGKYKVLLKMLDGTEEVFPIFGSGDNLEWWEIFALKRKILNRAVRIEDGVYL